MFTDSPLISLKAPTRSATWRMAVVCCLAAGLLSACGGGSASSGGVAVDPPPTDPTTPSTGNPSTSTTLVPGVYSATWDSKELTFVITRDTAISTTGKMYVLRFNSASDMLAQDPDIYAGTLIGIGANIANISSFTYFPNISGTLRTGSAALSLPSAGLLKTVASFAAIPADGARTYEWYANPSESLKMDTPALPSALVGRWNGRWSYGMGYVENFSLNFTADPSTIDPYNMSATSSMYFQQDCQITSGKTTPAAGGVNLFNVSFSTPNATQCFIKNQALTGVAYISSSPVAGKTQRLQWLATTADGRGVSFRADR